VSLPLYPSMTEEQVSYVISAVGDIVSETRKRDAVGADPSKSRCL